MRILAAILVVVLGSYGCVERAGEVDTPVVYDTIDGVPHVIGPEVGVWAEEGGAWSVDADQSVDIGHADGADPYVFGQISGAVLDPDGRLYVADAQAPEIRIFTLEGESIESIGRRGEGPGEFHHVSGLALAPDGVAALDGVLNRVTIFTPSGDVVTTFRLQRHASIMEHNAPMRFDDQGRFFDRARLSRTPDIDSIGVSVYRPSTEDVTTTLLTVFERDQVWLERSGSPYMQIPRPFGPQPEIAFGSDDRIYFSRGDEYRIEVFSLGGDVLRVIRRPLEGADVTDHARDSVFSFISESFEAMGAELPSSTRLPERRPVISSLVVDEGEHLWVLNARASNGEPLVWSVHDPDGRYLGDVELPSMTVTQITEGHVVGTIRDDLGVQRVRVLPILK